MTAGNKRSFTVIIAILLLMTFDIGFQHIANQIHRSLSAVDMGVLLSSISAQSVMLGFAMIMTAVFIKKGFLASVLFRKDRRSPWKFVLGFALIWPVLLSLTYGLVYLFDHPTWIAIANQPWPQTSTLLSNLFFQSIFPGLGEEPLYRGFLIVFLMGHLWDTNKSISTKHENLIILLSATIFAIAHVSYAFDPFTIFYDSYQLLTAFVLGGFQAFVFIKTRNLWGSIWIHNIANVTMTLFVLLIASIF